MCMWGGGLLVVWKGGVCVVFVCGMAGYSMYVHVWCLYLCEGGCVWCVCKGGERDREH